jgi:hypothetical protein
VKAEAEARRLVRDTAFTGRGYRAQGLSTESWARQGSTYL